MDHWKEQTQSADGTIAFESSKEKFIENAKKFKGNNSIKVFDSHFLKVEKNDLDSIDLFFYDADHSEQMNYLAVKYFADKLEDGAVLIFDDANWNGVVDGAKEGIADAGFEILYDKILLNETEDATMWWNGFYIAVINKIV